MKYNLADICDECKFNKLTYGNVHREYIKGNFTGRWLCNSCRSKYYKYGSYKKPQKIYNKLNICDECKTKKLSSSDANREYDYTKGIYTGRWLCDRCWGRYRQKNDPNSRNNIIKIIGDRRSGNLNPNSTQAKGDLFEELTCKWRGVDNLNKENDNYSNGTPIDHSSDTEGKIIQTRGKLYDYINRCWLFGGLEREWKKEFDYIICYCTSKDGKYIERIYIFLKKEVIKRAIDSNGRLYKYGWYEKYRVKDLDVLRKVNEIFYKLIDGEKYESNRSETKNIDV